MEMEKEGGVVSISIEHLQQQSLPLTGALSLSLQPSSSSTPHFLLNHNYKKRKRSHNNPIEGQGKGETLKTVNHPCIIIGSINLWNKNTCPCNLHGSDCVAFTDKNNTSICCVLVHLYPCLIGCQLHVLSWNFIPGRGGGCLEINKWRPLPPRPPSPLPPRPPSSPYYRDGCCTTVCGRLYAMSPPFYLPCLNPYHHVHNDDDDDSLDKKEDEKIRSPPPLPCKTMLSYKHYHENLTPFTTKRNNNPFHNTLRIQMLQHDNKGGNPDKIKILPLSHKQDNINGKCLLAEEENTITSLKVKEMGFSNVPNKENISNYSNNNAVQGTALGFLIELRACDHKIQCKRCSEDIFYRHTIAERQNACAKPAFIYFTGSSTAWLPVLSTLFGKCLTITGLKRKVLLVGKEAEEYSIFVATETSILSLASSKNISNQSFREDYHLTETSRMSISKLNGQGQCSRGSYIGVVTAIHMQGSLIELDRNVWLLLTHQPLTQVHGLRVGVILALRHVHFIKMQFTWETILLLGACFRSHIAVKSFSTLRTVFNTKPHSWSLLSRYIESLPFTAGFWVLLVTVCFRRKFRGFFCEKEILGSKNHKGMVQRYVHFWCSSFHLHRDVLKEFFKHSSCPIGKPTKTILQMVAPIINFCRQIEVMWVDHCSIIWSSKRYRLKEDSSLVKRRKEELASNDAVDGRHFVRRIISSKEFGVVLIGILQVTDFNVVVEGFWGPFCSLETKDDVQPLSCARIIDGLISKHKLSSVTYYVHFYLKKAINFSVPRCPAACLNNPSHIKMQEIQQGGVFGIMLVTHKYPITGKLVLDSPDQNSAKSFAEAVLLPYRIVAKDSKHNCSNRSHLDLETSSKVEDVIAVTDGNRNCCFETLKMIGSKKKFPFACSKLRTGHELHFQSYANSNIECMKCNITTPINCNGHGLQNDLSDCLYNEHKVSENYVKEFQLETPQEIRCSLVLRTLDKDDVLLDGILFPTMNCQDPNKIPEEDPYSKKVLLEFNCESLNFYQLLHIGDCYLIQYEAGDYTSDSGVAPIYMQGNKITVSSDNPIWSLLIASSHQIMQQNCNQTHFSSLCDEYSSSSLTSEFFDINKSASIDNVENRMTSIGWHSQASLVCHKDAILYIPCQAIDLLQTFIENAKDDVVPISMDAYNTFNKCLAHKTVPDLSQQFSKSADFDNGFKTEGNLLHGDFICLSGEVKNVHYKELNPFAKINKIGCKYVSMGGNLTFLPKLSYTIHVQVSHGTQKIRLCGTIDRCVLPLGFGPGVTASFYRLLLQREMPGVQDLLVTSASYIVVNTVQEVEYHSNGGHYTEMGNLLPGPTNWGIKDSILISCLSEGLTVECFRLRCRVVAIQSLVLEWQPAEIKSACPYIRSSTHILDSIQIIYGRFILDDGSGLCECWASGATAAYLLSMRSTAGEYFENAASLCKISKKGIKKRFKNTVGFLVGKLVKNHRQVTIQKNKTATSPHLDFMILGASKEILNPEEQRLISFVLERACDSVPLVIIGSILDSPDQQMREFEKCDQIERSRDQENFSTISQCQIKILARNVFPVNYLEETANGKAFEDLMSEI